MIYIVNKWICLYCHRIAQQFKAILP